MKYALLIFSIFLTSAMADMSHIKEIEKAKPNYGKALKVKDLKGKVILLEYWGLK